MKSKEKLSEVIRITKARAVVTLFQWMPPSKLAKLLGVSPGSICHWKTRGQVPRKAALRLAQIPDCPLSLEDIRPDVY